MGEWLKIREEYSQKFTRVCISGACLVSTTPDPKNHPIFDPCFRLSGFTDKDAFIYWARNLMDAAFNDRDVITKFSTKKLYRMFKNLITYDPAMFTEKLELYGKVSRYLSQQRRRTI